MRAPQRSAWRRTRSTSPSATAAEKTGNVARDTTTPPSVITSAMTRLAKPSVAIAPVPMPAANHWSSGTIRLIASWPAPMTSAPRQRLRSGSDDSVSARPVGPLARSAWRRNHHACRAKPSSVPATSGPVSAACQASSRTTMASDGRPSASA